MGKKLEWRTAGIRREGRKVKEGNDRNGFDRVKELGGMGILGSIWRIMGMCPSYRNILR